MSIPTTSEPPPTHLGVRAIADRALETLADVTIGTVIVMLHAARRRHLEAPSRRTSREYTAM
jgi:hypothetical protein